jgi:hypothetical protein
VFHALSEDDETAGEDSTADISFGVHLRLGRFESRLYGKV